MFYTPMNKKEHFFSTGNRIFISRNTIKRELNGIFFGINSHITSADPPVWSPFSDIYQKMQEQTWSETTWITPSSAFSSFL